MIDPKLRPRGFIIHPTLHAVGIAGSTRSKGTDTARPRKMKLHVSESVMAATTIENSTCSQQELSCS